MSQPLYVDLTELVPEGSEFFIRPTLDDYRDVATLVPIIDVFGKKLDLYRIDHDTKKIWVFIGIAKVFVADLCRTLPDELHLACPEKFSDNARVALREQFDQLATEKSFKMSDRLQCESKDSLIEIYVVWAALCNLQYMFSL